MFLIFKYNLIRKVFSVLSGHDGWIFENISFFFCFRNIFSNFIEFESPRAMATKYDNDTNNHFQERWRTKQEKFPKNVDHFFLLIMSIIIFFMQCGFAFMEAGAVRYVCIIFRYIGTCCQNGIAQFIWNAEISVSVAIHCYKRLF